MKIYVCVKQVPDTSGKVSVKPNGTLDRASMKTITNPDDLNAVEEALRIKDETGCEVIAVSMGPNPAISMLRECIAMGCDKGVLISGREFGGSDTFATSQIIAGGLHHLGVTDDDLIFCGRQAIDGDTAQVGPQIAEKLDIPQVTYAAQVKVEENSVIVKRLLEDGYMTVKVKKPCLITCVKELNKPRYMSIKGIWDCFDKDIEILDFNALKDEPLIDLTTIGLKGSPTNIFQSFTPPQKGNVEMLDSAKTLAEKLAKRHLI